MMLSMILMLLVIAHINIRGVNVASRDNTELKSQSIKYKYAHAKFYF